MSKNRFQLFYNLLLIPFDAMTLFLAFWSAYFFRYSGIRPYTSIMPKADFLKWVLILIPIWLVFFGFNKLYSFKIRPFTDEIVSIFMAISTGLAITFGLFFFSRTLFVSRLIILFAWVFAVIFVVLGRMIARIILKFLYFKGIGSTKILIVGKGKISQKIKRVMSDKFLGYKIIKQMTGGENINKICEIVKKNKIQEIVLAASNLSEKKMNQILEYCHEKGVVFRYSPSIFELRSKNIEIDTFGDIPIIELKRTPLDGWGRIVKRIIDIVGSFLALIITSPLFLIIPVIIKFDSKGSVFFRQKRVGLNKNFIFLKFRTMKKGAEKQHHKMMKKYGIMFKLKNDPRVTKVGKFLRKTSLDELPQLINVLKGDMSLVGPRPPMPEEVAKYNHWQKKRLGVKPGITGLWQVSGRSNLSFSEWVELDKYYIENWSMRLDFQILFRTFIVLITKVGAY